MPLEMKVENSTDDNMDENPKHLWMKVRYQLVATILKIVNLKTYINTYRCVKPFRKSS